MDNLDTNEITQNNIEYTVSKKLKKQKRPKKNGPLNKSRLFFDDKLLGKIIKFIFALFFAFSLVIFTEAITFNSYTLAFGLISRKPLLFFFDFVLTAVVFYFFTLIVKRFSISIFLTSLLYLGLSIANIIKFNSNDAPLYPWDLLMIQNIGNITDFASETIKISSFMVFGALFILPFLALAIVFDFKVKYRPLNIVKCVCIIIIFMTFITSNNVKTNFVPKIGATPGQFQENNDFIFKDNGFITGFMINLMYSIISPPEGYTKENMELLNEKYKLTTQEKEVIKNLDLKNSPNIVILLSETFWDPRNLPGVTFSTNPVSNYERLSQEGRNGEMAVSAFGGGTIRTEFEILTGFSNLILLPGTLPYQQYVKKPIETLPSYFKYLGYQTTSIHPFAMDFYNRDTGHAYMGFEKSVFYEDMVDPVWKGSYISDKYYTDQLINEIKSVNSGDKPLFLFGASMQNHQAYSKEKYEGIDLDIESKSDLSQEDNEKITAFAQGVFDADKELGRLCDFLKTQDRETIVLFFGDHLPTLGQNKSIYYNTGYLEKNPKNPLESRKQVMTPYLLWSNKQNIPDDNVKKGAYLLGGDVLALTNIPKMPVYKMLDDSKEYFLCVNEKVSIDSKGNFVKEITSEKGKEYINTHKLFTYDLLLGKGYEKIGFLPKKQK